MAAAAAPRKGPPHVRHLPADAARRDAGAWNATLVAPPQTATPYASWPSGFFRAGFDSNAKAHFLVRKVPSAGGYLEAHEP